MLVGSIPDADRFYYFFLYIFYVYFFTGLQYYFYYEPKYTVLPKKKNFA